MTIPDLARLSLTQLAEFRRRLRIMEYGASGTQGGEDEEGWDLEFSVLPDRPMTMTATLPALWPGDPRPEALRGIYPPPPAPEISDFALAELAASEGFALRPATAADMVPAAGIEPATPEIPAPDRPAEPVEIAPEPEPEPQKPDAGEAPSATAMADAGAEVPGGDPAPRPQRADAWTEAELARAMDLGIAAVLAGRSVNSAYRDLAAETGRTWNACSGRLMQLRAEIEAGAAKRMPAGPAAPREAPHSGLPQDELQAHLDRVRSCGGWSLSEDLRMMRLVLDGWPLHEVALEIQVASETVKARFGALTDKKGRNWPRADVLARLELMAGPEAA